MLSSLSTTPSIFSPNFPSKTGVKLSNIHVGRRLTPTSAWAEDFHATFLSLRQAVDEHRGESLLANFLVFPPFSFAPYCRDELKRNSSGCTKSNERPIDERTEEFVIVSSTLFRKNHISFHSYMLYPFLFVQRCPMDPFETTISIDEIIRL